MNLKLSRCRSFVAAFFTVLCAVRNTCGKHALDSRQVVVLVFLLSSTAQSNGPILLYQFGDNGVIAGIVRIFYNGAWGNICDHGSFGMVEANVACRQAGYAGAFWFSTTGNSRYVCGHGPAGNVHCASTS